MNRHRPGLDKYPHLIQGKISVTKARVMVRDKDRTKTSEDRLVELCPRALHVLKTSKPTARSAAAFVKLATKLKL